MDYYFKFLLYPLLCDPISLRYFPSILRKNSGDAAFYYYDLFLDRLGAPIHTKIDYFLRVIHAFNTSSDLRKILSKINLVTHSELSR